MPRRVIVIGAGPIGLYAAWEAVRRGLEVTLLERDAAGAALERWGPVRMFSPLSMNVPADIRRELGLHEDGALLTGREMIDRVLLPLASHPLLAGRVLTGRKVVAIGRRGLGRGDYAGHPLRAERPFRLLVERDGSEEQFEAEVILDASGGYAIPRSLGAGGLRAPGERAFIESAFRHLGPLNDGLGELRGRRVLLVGNGHSAAHAASWLLENASEVCWAVRTPNRHPIAAVANDPLPARQSVVDRANQIADAPPPGWRIERRASIESLSRRNGHIDVSLSGDRIVQVDSIAAFTGYRPDSSFLTELGVELSPATEGTARLWKTLSSATDCLSVPAAARADLETGEPGYYFIGSRSYGRASTFLLRHGIEQIETLLREIAA